MRHYLMIAICVFVAVVVLWVCIHPNIDLAPTALRFTAFAATVMFLLRQCFRFAKPALVVPFASEWAGSVVQAHHLEVFASLQVPLRC